MSGNISRPALVINGAIVTSGIFLLITPPNLSTTNSISSNDTLIKNTNIQNNTIISGNVKVNNPTKVVSNPSKTVDQPISNTTTTPSPTQAPEPVKTAINGTFTGDVVDISYGNMQIKITVQNNQITDVQAVQYPNSGKSGDLNRNAIAILRQETLAAQSSNIAGVSGASYTSYGFYKSLVSALNKAGL